MKGKFISYLAGFIMGALVVITFNSLDRVAAFEVRQSAESIILDSIGE